MLPFFLRGRAAEQPAHDGEDASADAAAPPGPHSGASTDVQLARRFARALTLRGRRARLVHTSAALTTDGEASRVPTGRKRGARTRNCATHRREERRQRRALMRLAVSSLGRRQDGEPPRETAGLADSVGALVLAGRGSCESEEEAQLLGAIRSLQADIAQLERASMLRDSALISWRTNRTGAALDMANEYVLQLSGGYDPCSEVRAGQSARGREFMEKLLLPDIMCRDFQGLEPFMNQWEKYTIFHDDFQCRLSGMRVLKDSDTLVSIYIASDFHLTFTDKTVKFLYPSLDAEARRDAHTRGIVDQLIGARVRLPLDIVLHFNEHGRVFAFESRSHLATALLEVLEDPAAAMHVFCLANMTVDGHWKLTPDPDALERQRLMPQALL